MSDSIIHPSSGAAARPSTGDELLAGIAGRIGTPFWSYDAGVIRRQIAALRRFDLIRFAQKANSNINILRLMRAEGVMVDAVSAGEVERALAAGYEAREGLDQIVFTADLLEPATVSRLVALGIPVNCGSPEMIAQIGAARPGHPVWLRINPGFGHGHSRKTNTGGPSSKHGIWHEGVEEALALVDRYGLRLVGLHMHIGSGVDYGHLRSVCDAMIGLAKLIGRPIDAISAGGGLSVPYRDGEPELDTAHYHAIWDQARREIEAHLGRKVRLEIEPGRYLVAQSGTLVAEVRAVKPVADKIFVLVNAGFNELARPVIYGAHHRIRFLRPDGSPVTGPSASIALAGPLCEAGDVFTQKEEGIVEFREMPLPAVGDLAVIDDAGAYGASMSSNYNTRPLAPEVLIDNGTLTLIRERQDLGDLFRLERSRALTPLA
ncbi:MAG: diaminopimelate decarboxylase [Inquilinus sp.]|uniref:diaminopimelate decarboxylase n=1 Tax=Inquilinus sp. TaxID=1932117 RepID=UPI003F33CB3A